MSGAEYGVDDGNNQHGDDIQYVNAMRMIAGLEQQIVQKDQQIALLKRILQNALNVEKAQQSFKNMMNEKDERIKQQDKEIKERIKNSVPKETISKIQKGYTKKLKLLKEEIKQKDEKIKRLEQVNKSNITNNENKEFCVGDNDVPSSGISVNEQHVMVENNDNDDHVLESSETKYNVKNNNNNKAKQLIDSDRNDPDDDNKPIIIKRANKQKRKQINDPNGDDENLNKELLVGNKVSNDNDNNDIQFWSTNKQDNDYTIYIPKRLTKSRKDWYYRLKYKFKMKCIDNEIMEIKTTGNQRLYVFDTEIPKNKDHLVAVCKLNDKKNAKQKFKMVDLMDKNQFYEKYQKRLNISSKGWNHTWSTKDIDKDEKRYRNLERTRCPQKQTNKGTDCKITQWEFHQRVLTGIKENELVYIITFIEKFTDYIVEPVLPVRIDDNGNYIFIIYKKHESQHRLIPKEMNEDATDIINKCSLTKNDYHYNWKNNIRNLTIVNDSSSNNSNCRPIPRSSVDMQSVNNAASYQINRVNYIPFQYQVQQYQLQQQYFTSPIHYSAMASIPMIPRSGQNISSTTTFFSPHRLPNQ